MCVNGLDCQFWLGVSAVCIISVRVISKEKETQSFQKLIRGGEYIFFCMCIHIFTRMQISQNLHGTHNKNDLLPPF